MINLVKRLSLSQVKLRFKKYGIAKVPKRKYVSFRKYGLIRSKSYKNTFGKKYGLDVVSDGKGKKYLVDKGGEIYTMSLKPYDSVAEPILSKK